MTELSRIPVYVYASLRQYTGGAASVQVEVAPGDTMDQVLDRAGVPRDRVHIIFADHRAVQRDYVLTGTERIDLFSAIGGG